MKTPCFSRLASAALLWSALVFLSGCETPPSQPAVPGSTLGQQEEGANLDLSAVDRRPEPKFQKKPIYPFELKKRGVTGSALVDFVVDTDGNVRNAFFLSATHPDFGPAAVAAVSAWKFHPGEKNGHPVNTHMQVPILFTLGKPGAPLSMPAAKPLSPDDRTVPTFEVSEVDVRPTERYQAKPRYPARLRAQGIPGSSVVDFIVDENGAVRNAHSVGETDPSFADAAVEAVSQWVFRPGKKDGQIVRTHMQVPINFSVNGQ